MDHWAVTIHSPLNFDCKTRINPNENLIIDFKRDFSIWREGITATSKEAQGVMEIPAARPHWAGTGAVLLGVLMLEISCILIETTDVDYTS